MATAPAHATAGSDTIVVTEKDDQAQITLHQGQQLLVKLKPSGIFHWDQPRSTDASVLRAGAPRGGRGGHRHKHGSVSTTFKAVGQGTADVESSGAPVCKRGKVCILRAGAPTALVVRLWQVHVQVV
jgi:predicted secreted protein